VRRDDLSSEFPRLADLAANGAQPKGRQLKIGLERSRVLARSATDRRKPEPFAASPRG